MYKDRREWADTHETQVVDILKTLISHLVVLSVASDETDKKYATDLEVKLIGGTIAVRLRKPDCKFRDLTIRALLDSGARTELAKIQEGYAFRYFYGWIDDAGNIVEWILVDLNKARETGLLNKKRSLIPNYDGTYFIAITIDELEKTGCLLSCNPQTQRQINLHPDPDEGIERARHREYYKPRMWEDYA